MLRVPGVPAGVSPDMLSWDLISLKVPPNAIELLIHRNPGIVESLSEV